MDGKICNFIADQLAVFNNILSIMIVYVVNIDSSATRKGDFLHPLGTNLHSVGIKIDTVSISHKFQFMMEDGRESTPRVHCECKIWVNLGQFQVGSRSCPILLEQNEREDTEQMGGVV